MPDMAMSRPAHVENNGIQRHWLLANHGLLPVVHCCPAVQNCHVDADLQCSPCGYPAVQRWYSVGFQLVRSVSAKPVEMPH